MKIESSADKTLDNGAVLLHLNELRSKQQNKESKHSTRPLSTDKAKDDYDHITSKVTEYFKSAATEGHLPNYANFPPKHIEKLMTRLKKYDLVKSEMLMLLNLKPRDLVFLDCIIEELDDRHPDEEEQARILEIINESLSSSNPHIEDDQDTVMR